MNILTWPLVIVLLALSPEFRCSSDRRESDGERYTSVCAGLFQRAETWTCVEVGR